MEAWHFIKEDCRLRYNDYRLVVPGETITVLGPIAPCRYGLHASESIMHALQYAPGPVVCHVRLGGKIVRETDKAVASERTCLWMIDATEVLDEFARACALKRIDSWDAPAIVKNYLQTGDSSIRKDTRELAWSHTEHIRWKPGIDAARSAAWAADDNVVRAARHAAKWCIHNDNESHESRLIRMINEARKKQ